MRLALATTVPVLLVAATFSLAPAAPREVRAARTARAPVIDGQIEPDLWTQAPEISGLSQQRPDNGFIKEVASDERRGPPRLVCHSCD